MSTNTMSYHDRIRKNQKDVDELLFTEQEEDNQLQLEADLRETKRAITKKRRELNTARSAGALSGSNLSAIKGEIRALKLGAADVEEELRILFPPTSK